MEKNIGWLLTVIAVFGLLIGGLVGYNMAPTKVITETQTEIVYQNVSVDKLVEILTSDISIYLTNAVEDFLEYVDDEDKTRCGGDRYDIDEISISRVYDGYTVMIDEDDYQVDFKVRLKYDEDDERSCRKIFNVEAYYEADEDVNITLA
jgi:hypothetical protein